VSPNRDNPPVAMDALERRSRRPSADLYAPAPHPAVRGPRFRSLSGYGVPDPHAAEAEAASRVSYVRALETQVGTLTETVRALEQRLAAYARRNEELEASRAQAEGVDRAAVQELLRQAEQALAEAETHVGTLREEAQRQAGEILGQAQVQANDMIEAVSAEIAEIEAEAAVAAQTAEAEALRGQIRDLMRLRESILTSIRAAVDGFGEELDILEQPLFEPETPTAAVLAAVPAPDAGATPAEQFEVSLLVRPVDGVIAASGIERGLEDAGATAHLRAVEGTTAEYAVSGLSPDEIRTAAGRLFPDGQCEWVAADRMQVVLAPAKAS
jgi:polyhydroxyalkanoate synthesis regulator phasin